MYAYLQRPAVRRIMMLPLPLLLLPTLGFCLLFPTSAYGAVVAFTGGDYRGYPTWDWGAITHLGFWTEPTDDVRALAHKHGVRLYADAGIPDKRQWTNATARAQSTASWVAKVQKHQLDGLFFDFEGNGLSKAQKQAYAQLAQETTEALRPLNASIFICVGGRPTYEMRDYPYAELAAASEFLFIMGYDMHFWDDYTCVVKGTCSPAEASIKDLSSGVHDYIQLVHPQKLVLGLPWYGQRYTDIVVPINEGQIDYRVVLEALDKPGLVTKKEFDATSQSWKITCKQECDVDPGDKSKSGNVVWYDDNVSLAPKYRLARDHGLLGVGMWKADNLPVPDEHGNDPHKVQRQAMWTAVAAWNRTHQPLHQLRRPPSIHTRARAAVVHIVQTTEASDRLARKDPVALLPSRSTKVDRNIAVSLGSNGQTIKVRLSKCSISRSTRTTMGIPLPQLIPRIV